MKPSALFPVTQLDTYGWKRSQGSDLNLVIEPESPQLRVNPL